MSPLFFIHVPKTAGTSFRKAAEHYFSKEKICYDYGLKQPETSTIIRERIYQKNDFFGLKNDLNKQSIRMLGGHVSAHRFAPIVNQNHVFTFVREPISRLVSEFKHFKRHYNFEGELADFIRRPEFINRQFRMLQGYPPHMLGFIGITEHYSESLKLFNHLYQSNLEDLSLNMAGNEKAPAYSLDQSLVEEIEKLNKQEINHYQKCCELFHQRFNLFKDDLPFTHGQVSNYENGKLFGWAFNNEVAGDPVELSILVNDKPVADALANERRSNLLHFNVPRDAFVGFSCKVGTLKENDKVSIIVKSTGQELTNSPKVIS